MSQSQHVRPVAVPANSPEEPNLILAILGECGYDIERAVVQCRDRLQGRSLQEYRRVTKQLVHAVDI